MEDLRKILKVGQLVAIDIADEQERSARYRSRVENLEKEELVLASPIKNRVPIFLSRGTPVNVWYWDNIAIYTFRSVVLRSAVENVPVVLVEYPEKIERVQNREYVRVPYSLEVQLKWEDYLGQAMEVHCKSRDLSGGGMMLVLIKPIKLEKNTDVYIDFELDGRPFKTMGSVIWNDWEIDSDGIERNIIGIKFTFLSEKERQYLIKHVYQKQIELRRKGLL
ncbi:MAG: flagellar brake domain-containing protein [Peptococcaceae bacterium]|jgi:c-di-GMP-binding flagellar brake protein YcgR|nr:flagellar brake domain-containing protein [Peptococcaceae bacterium]MDH7524057.1 flagellar brake domain-containing protein [Peptococcaceae bacterium]